MAEYLVFRNDVLAAQGPAFTPLGHAFHRDAVLYRVEPIGAGFRVERFTSPAIDLASAHLGSGRTYVEHGSALIGRNRDACLVNRHAVAIPDTPAFSPGELERVVRLATFENPDSVDRA